MEEFKEKLKAFWNLPISLKAYYYLLFLTFGNIFFYYLRPIINVAGMSQSADNVFTVFWIVGIYFSISLIIKTISLIDIVAYLAICSFYYLSPTIYPATRYFVDSTFSIFALQTFPLYFLALMLDFRRDKSALTVISILQLGFTAFFVLLSLLGLINSTATGEQMFLSYSVLFPTMFMYYNYSKDKKLLNLLFFVLGVALILMFGTRGPLVCLIIFLLLFLFKNFRNNTILTVNLLLVIGAIYIFLKPIMIVLMFLTRMVGLSTRIFESYFDDELMNYEKSSGRNDIHDLLWNNIINDRAGIGYGLGSDRLMGRSGTEYAHNLVYEVWMDFGIYIGSILLILLLFAIIRTGIRLFKDERFNLFLMLLVFSVVHNLFSGSYLHDFHLYFFLGYCVNIWRSKEDMQEDEEDEDVILALENNIESKSI